MRIAIAIILIAVVSLGARAVGWQTRSTSNESTYDWTSSESEEMSTEVSSGSRWLSYRESQMLLRKEGGEKGLPVDCCPSDLEMVEPEGGTNQDGMYVELYREGKNKQRFYELSCRAGVEGRPCLFMDRKLHNQSRCIQRYSYTYAIVKLPNGDEVRHHHRANHFTNFPTKDTNWMLDYIRVRSGCSCEVSAKLKKKRNSHKSKRGKSRRESEEEPH